MPVTLPGLKRPVFRFTRQFEGLSSLSMLPGWSHEQSEKVEYLAVKVDLLRPDTWLETYQKVMGIRRAQLEPTGWTIIGWGCVDACDRARPMLAAFLRSKP